MKKLFSIALVLFAVLCLASPTLAQETTNDVSLVVDTAGYAFLDVATAAARSNGDSQTNLLAPPIWNQESLPENYILQSLDGEIEIYSHSTQDSLLVYQATDGDDCFVVESYVDGLWHRIIWNGLDCYVSPLNLDLSTGDFSYTFNSEQDMRFITGYTAAELAACLDDKLLGWEDSFSAAEQKYGVNALFLIAICQMESANGTSSLAIRKNNLAGLKTSGGFASFSDYGDCIDYLAAMLAEKYLDPQGVFYHGSTIKGVSITYCNGSSHWQNVVANNMEKNQQRIMQAIAATDTENQETLID